MVPKKGLEPPHRCRYMDLNHARLPIPPLRLEECDAAPGLKPHSTTVDGNCSNDFNKKAAAAR